MKRIWIVTFALMWSAIVGFAIFQQHLVIASFTAVGSIVSVFMLFQLSAKLTTPTQEPKSKIDIADLIADKLSINAVSAAEVSFAIDELKSRVSSQVSAIEQVSVSSSSISSTLKESSEFAQATSITAQEMHTLSTHGADGLIAATSSMQKISTQTSATLSRIENLEGHVNQISTVTQVIEDIASQTNLLALNAAIEAARAGEQGRGFAVVADEVRKLAERTATSTDEVSQIVQKILSETGDVVQNITLLSDDVTKGSSMVQEVSQQLEDIANQATTVDQQVTSISDGVLRNEQGLEQISAAIDSVKDDLSESNSSLKDLQQEGEHLMSIAEESNAIFAEHHEESIHRPYYDYVASLAKKVSEKFEQDISAGVISKSALFDTNYQPIPNTHPAKFKTQFDNYCDKTLPTLQEPLLTQDKNIVYAIANDMRGYVPTHNKIFTKPLTGDEQKDIAGNRTKRIFDDKVGQRCSAHTNIMLLQTYKRDTGEVMHDISVPVMVDGKQWGSIRMGYQPPHLAS